MRSIHVRTRAFTATTKRPLEAQGSGGGGKSNTIVCILDVCERRVIAPPSPKSAMRRFVQIKRMRRRLNDRCDIPLGRRCSSSHSMLNIVHCNGKVADKGCHLHMIVVCILVGH